MQLHANAALSLNGRRAMVSSVVEDGLSVAEAAGRAGIGERVGLCGRGVLGRARGRGVGGATVGGSGPPGARAGGARGSAWRR